MQSKPEKPTPILERHFEASVEQSHRLPVQPSLQTHFPHLQTPFVEPKIIHISVHYAVLLILGQLYCGCQRDYTLRIYVTI